MRYSDLAKFVEKLDSGTLSAKKKALLTIVNTSTPYSQLHAAALFEYAYAFYEEGKFRQVERIIEPLITQYMSFTYCEEIVLAYLLKGVIRQSSQDYDTSKYYYEMAYVIAKQHKSKRRYFMCLNNLATFYGSTSDYANALEYFSKAEKQLDPANEYHHALLHLNKAVAYVNLEKFELALKEYEVCLSYRGLEYPISGLVKCCAVSIYYGLKEKEKFEIAKHEVLEIVEQLPVSHAIDTYIAILNQSIVTQDETGIQKIMDLIDKYLKENPLEYRMGLKFYSFKYLLAKAKNDSKAIIETLEQKDYYYSKLLEENEKKLTKEVARAVEINNLKHANEIAKKENRILKKLSYTDSLTGIENRHAYNVRLQDKNKNISRVSTYMIMDIDDFKSINDNYSHLEGDNVLSAVGKVLNGISSESIHCYRYGGDEFVVIINDYSFDGAMEILMDIRNQIIRIKYNGGKNLVSCTMGIASSMEFSDIRSLVKAADRRLYIGKARKGEMITEG